MMHANEIRKSSKRPYVCAIIAAERGRGAGAADEEIRGRAAGREIAHAHTNEAFGSREVSRKLVLSLSLATPSISGRSDI
jgi:hypothetical protein